MDTINNDLEVFFHSPDAEEFIIGCLLADPHRTFEAADQMGVTPTWFHLRVWRDAWESAIDLRTQGHVIEVASLRDLMKRRSTNGDSSVILARLQDANHKPTNLLYHLSQLRDRRLKRFLRETFETHGSRLQTTDDAREILTSLQFELSGFTEEYEAPVSPEEMVEGLGAKYTAASCVGYTGIPSRWPQSQEILGGYQKGKVYPVASRPKKGKTTFGCNEGLNAAQTGFPVLWISTEMSAEEIRAKMIADELGLDLFRFQTGNATKDEIASFVECGHRQAQLPITIIEGNQSIDSVRTIMMDHGKRHKMCIVDYMQNLQPSKKDPKPKLDRLERGSQLLTATAKDTGMATLALLQLGRGAELDERGKRRLPLVSHIKGTGSYEQDAQAIILIARHKSMMGDEEYNDDQPTIIRIAYNRGGPIGTMDFNFKKTKNRLEPCAMQGFE